MDAPPAIFTQAQAEFAAIMKANGLVQIRTEYHAAAFGSAFAEYRGATGALRLVWDGKDAVLLAEVLVDGQWTDVESLVAGRAMPIDRDQSNDRIARILQAATAALSGRR